MKWVLRAAAFFVVPAGAAVAVLHFDGPFRKSETLWTRPWDAVRVYSEGLCRKIAKDDDAFGVCMSIERESHALLQTSFDLPEEEAAALKRRCAEFEYFTPQLRCVENRLRRRRAAN